MVDVVTILSSILKPLLDINYLSPPSSKLSMAVGVKCNRKMFASNLR